MADATRAISAEKLIIVKITVSWCFRIALYDAVTASILTGKAFITLFTWTVFATFSGVFNYCIFDYVFIVHAVSIAYR